MRYLCVCVVCVYVCMCVCPCACTGTCMYMCVCVYACVCVHVRTHVYMCACACACMCVIECTHAYVCMSGTVIGSLFWLNGACSSDPVENSTRDRKVSHVPRVRCLTPQSPQLHNSVTISHADNVPSFWHSG